MMLANASISANARYLQASLREVENGRISLMKSLFPHMKVKEQTKIEDEQPNYDEYFDELDRIIAAEKEKQADSADTGEEHSEMV